MAHLWSRIDCDHDFIGTSAEKTCASVPGTSGFEELCSVDHSFEEFEIEDSAISAPSLASTSDDHLFIGLVL
jgi:hypothetical protein